MTGPADEPVLTSTEGRVARIVLNRPRVINALNHDMVLRIAAALAAWRADPQVEAVVITGAGERGLCAGGDIRAVHDDASRGDGREAALFWRDEYRLNAVIASYPKPYVAVMDGIVMGGGVGVSAHGEVRVVTERSLVGMPETAIGFVPDVGGTYLLSRAPGELGTHLALTGMPVGAGDAVLCGLADHFISSDRLPEFTAALAHEAPEVAVAEFGTRCPDGELAGHREWIDHCYAADSVEEIVARLRSSGITAAKQTAEIILTKSPTSLKVTLAAVRRARGLSGLEDVLAQEFRVSCALLSAPDLVEGVRAQIIDKDRNPRWSPATLGEVSAQDVERPFAHPADLWAS